MQDQNEINNQSQERQNFNPQPSLPIKQENNPNSFKSSFLTNSLITFLICVFAGSLISAAYIIFNPAFAGNRTEIQENEETSFIKFKKKDSGRNIAASIKIRGVIQETQGGSPLNSNQNASAIAAKIRDLAEEKDVKALVLDINSPGGTVASVQDIYNAILYFKSKDKPVIALFRDIAASGGYYIATAADIIVAQPGTITGSIGVIMQGVNIAPLLERFGVSFKPIKSAKHKDIGSPYREMTEEEQQLLQDMINDTYAQFFNAVKKARPNIPEEKLRIYADGRVWTGSQAKALGLIDEFGGMETAKKILEEKTGIKDIKIKNVGSNALSEFGFLLNSAQTKLDTKIDEITTPKVLYLWTY